LLFTLNLLLKRYNEGVPEDSRLKATKGNDLDSMLVARYFGQYLSE
jgi:hypothetical protein